MGARIFKARFIWVPSIGVGGIKFYQGNAFPEWQNSLLVGSLKYQYLSVLHREGDKFINEEIDPQIEKMHLQLIRVIDQVRMLDQDMIRLQQKVNVVLEYKENEKKKRNKRGGDNGKT